MRVVHKFPVPITDRFEIALPSDAKVLSVQVQYGEPYLWVLLDPNAVRALRKFSLVGTGLFVGDDDLSFIGTFQLHGGALVFHLFERQG